MNTNIVFKLLLIGLVVVSQKASAQGIISAVRLSTESPVFSSSSVRPLPSVRSAPHSADFRVIDWMGETIAPRSMGSTESERVIIVADTIDLSDGNFSRAAGTAPKHVILIADTIKLSSKFQLDLSNVGQDVHGGQFTVVARRLELTPKATFNIISQGHPGVEIPQRSETYTVRKPHPGPYRTNFGGSGTPKYTTETQTRLIPGRIEPGGSGGDVIMMFGEANLGTSSGLLVTGDDLAALVTSHVSTSLQGGLSSSHGSLKVIQVEHLPAAADVPRQAIIEWHASMLTWLVSDMQRLAVQQPPFYRRDLLASLARTGKITEYGPAIAHPAFGICLDSIRNLKRDLFPELWEGDQIEVELDGVRHHLVPLAEGLANHYYLPPTEALIKPVTSPTGPKLGLLRTEPGPELSVQIEFDLELTIDKRLEAAAKERIETLGGVYNGLFHSWRLTPSEHQVEGVQSLSIRQMHGAIRCTLVLEKERESLERVLVRLASRKGIPLELNWRYAPNSRFEGRPFQVFATISRRTQSGVHVKGRTVTNLGVESVAIEYVETAEGIHPLEPSLLVAAGENVELPSEAVAIPPTGVTTLTDLDGPSLLNHFLVAQPHTTTTVQLYHRLPQFDGDPENGLQHVEFKISWTQRNVRFMTDVYCLQANESESEFHFPRVAEEPAVIVAEGSAVYATSRRHFRVQTEDESRIYITRNHFQ